MCALNQNDTSTQKIKLYGCEYVMYKMNVVCKSSMQPAYVTSNFLTTRILHNNREAHTRKKQHKHTDEIRKQNRRNVTKKSRLCIRLRSRSRIFFCVYKSPVAFIHFINGCFSFAYEIILWCFSIAVFRLLFRARNGNCVDVNKCSPFRKIVKIFGL